MTDSAVNSLVLDLLEWVTKAERTYDEVMDAWRTSCPRLQVWEDANDRALLSTELVNGRCVVKATALGLSLLKRTGRAAAERQTRS
jgi:hypothetical protein